MDRYSESVLASYVTYKELYSNGGYKSIYQILAEFIKQIIASEEIYSFSISELRKKIQDIYGFQVPNAVIKSSIKHIDYIERIQNSNEYSVNRQKVSVDAMFGQYKEKAEKENTILTNRLISYAETKRKEAVNRKELVQELVAYLLDESNGGKYQEVISSFILENGDVRQQLNAIREGSILYLGLNCNISETGSITNELTLFLDMEILFDIYGYNGEVFQCLASDLLSVVDEANKSSKRIKLKYFIDTKKEISDFFTAAEEIVKTGTYLRENAAMKAIVNGCKNSTDVRDKESDFFHDLQYRYSIVLDEREEYYTKDDNVFSLEETLPDDKELVQELKPLSNINKLRKGKIFYDYTKVGYLFVTETRKTLELAKIIADDQSGKQTNNDEGNICKLATNMSFLTNLLWYKLNRGFGATNYPHNLDAVIKAKIVLANFISQNVNAIFDKYRKEYTEGVLTADQMAGRILGLRGKAYKPEDITSDNLLDNLNFDLDYLQRYEEEREIQKVLLVEKEELIKQLTETQKVSQNELQKVISDIKDSEARSADKDEIIAEQKAELEAKNRLLEHYKNEENRKICFRNKIKNIIAFGAEVLVRILIVILVGVVAYYVAINVFADQATTISIIVTCISIAFSVKDIISRVYRKYFSDKCISTDSEKQ